MSLEDILCPCSHSATQGSQATHLPTYPPTHLMARSADAEAEYERIKADPSIGVSDIQTAVDAWFRATGTRDIGMLLDVIKVNKVSWKTAPKAPLHLFSLNGICHHVLFHLFVFRDSFYSKRI